MRTILILSLIVSILFQSKLSQISVYYTVQATRNVMLPKDHSLATAYSVNKITES